MKDLIKKLKLQHIQMLKLMKATSAILNTTKKYSNIENLLNQFKKIFVDHIYLENRFVYPAILESQRMTRAGALSIEIFLKDIENIQNETIVFLNKYRDVKKIKNYNSKFKEDLTETIKILEDRITIEEEMLFEVFQRQR